MDVKRLAGATLLALTPLLLSAPAAFADDASNGGPTLDVAIADGAEVAGVQARVSTIDAYEARLAAWAQPGAVRVQPGMISSRALLREDSATSLNGSEVAGVRASAIEVAGVQAGQPQLADYLSQIQAYPSVSGMRPQPGMVSSSSLQRGDSLWAPEAPFSS